MRSDKVVRDFTQSGYEKLEARRLQTYARLSVPVLDCPHGENKLSCIHSGLLLFEHSLIASCPVTGYPCGEPDCLLTSLYRQTLAVKVSPKSSLLQAESAQLLLPLLIGQVLWLLEHLVGYCVRVLGVLLVLWGSKTRCIRPCLE